MLSRDQFASLLYHEHQQLQRQAFQPNRAATAAELEATIIQLEIVETDLLIRQCRTPRRTCSESAAFTCGGSRALLGLHPSPSFTARSRTPPSPHETPLNSARQIRCAPP